MGHIYIQYYHTNINSPGMAAGSYVSVYMLALYIYIYLMCGLYKHIYTAVAHIYIYIATLHI